MHMPTYMSSEHNLLTSFSRLSRHRNFRFAICY